jgi:hypothetical protein
MWPSYASAVKTSALLLAFSVAAVACTPDQPTGLSGGATVGTGSGVGSSGNGSTSASSGGGGTGGEGGMLPAADFDVSIDDTMPSMNLDDSTVLGITVEPNGFTGDVELTVDNLPDAGVTTAFGDATLALDGTNDATTTLTLTTATSTAPDSLVFHVTGTSAGTGKSASATLTIHPDLTIVIPMGVDGVQGTQANPNKDAFGSYPIAVTAPAGISASNPLNVHFFNADAVPHQIHASNPNEGFGHDQNDIEPNSMDAMVRAVNKAGQYDFYLHDEGGPFTVGRLVIQ